MHTEKTLSLLLASHFGVIAGSGFTLKSVHSLKPQTLLSYISKNCQEESSTCPHVTVTRAASVELAGLV